MKEIFSCWWRLMRFKFPINKIKNSISGEEIEKVAIQLPEGLKRYGKDIVAELKTEFDKTFILSGYPCYGACDLKDIEFSELGVDKLIHLGHFEIPFKKNLEVDFFPIKSTLEIKSVLKEALDYLEEKEIGIITTPQYHHRLKEIISYLRKRGFEPKVGEGGSRITKKGIVLGCDFSAINTLGKELLYLGSGNFHPLGAALYKKTDVVAGDPETNSVKKINYRKLLKKRFSIISKVKDLDKFGVVISSKKGQFRFKRAKEINELINNSLKESDLILMDDVVPDQLFNLKYDAYVNTACPRISIDDYDRFNEPLITPIEAEIAFGEREYEDYKLDSF